MKAAKKEKKIPQSARRRAWWIALIALVLLVPLVLALLPFGLEWGLERWLARHGAAEAEIESVDFNPFTGTLVIHSLQGYPDKGKKLAFGRLVLRFDWRSLIKKRVLIQKLSLEEGSLKVERRADGRFILGGLQPKAVSEKTEEERGKPWAVGIESLDLQNVRIGYRDPYLENDLLVEQAHLENLKSWTPETASPFFLRMEIDGGTIRLQGWTKPFAPHRSADMEINIEALPLAWLAPLAEREAIRGLGGNAEARTTVQVRLPAADSPFEVRLEGKIGVRDLQGESPQGRLYRADLAWNGKIRWQGGQPVLALEGELISRETDLELAGAGLRLRHERLTGTGNLTYSRERGRDETGIQGRWDVAATDLRIDRQTGEERLAAAETLEMKGFQLRKAGLLDADRILVTGLRAFPLAGPDGGKASDAHLLAVQKLEVIQPRLQKGERLEIMQLLFQGAEGRLVLTRQGRLVFPRRIAAGDKGKPATASKEAKRPPFTFAVARAQITGSSRLIFEDREVSPNVRLDLESLEAQVRNLDSGMPGRKSPVRLTAKPGPYSSVRLEGFLLPFGNIFRLELQGKIASLDLPPLSPYAERALGYRLKSGHLDADITWEQKSRKADSEFDLLLHNPQLVQGEGQDSIAAQLGLSLNTALSLLRNDKGDVRLHLTIAEEIGSPRVDLSQILATALSKAIRKGLVSYFAPLGVTLVTGVTLPPGTLLVAEKLYELLTALRFRPVEFPPLSAELTGDRRNYLDTMAELLRDRPEVRLNLCGIAAPSDVRALLESGKTGLAGKGAPGSAKDEGLGKAVLSEEERNRLLALAQERATAVKNYLVDQGGIAPARLFICAPAVIDDPAATPRVEVGI